MTTDELLEIVKARGLRIVLKDGRPVLQPINGREGVTDKLMAVLTIHRERIIERLKRAEVMK